MALRHTAVLRRHRQRKHVAVIIQVHANQRIDRSDHLPVSLVAGFPVGLKKFRQSVNLIVGNALNGHVAHAHLIRVIGSASFQTGAFHGHTALHADGCRHLYNFRSFQKFLRAGDGIMVNNSSGTQSLHAGCIHCRRGGIRGKGICGMDVVVNVLRHHGRKGSFLQHLSQVVEALLSRGGV